MLLGGGGSAWVVCGRVHVRYSIRDEQHAVCLTDASVVPRPPTQPAERGAGSGGGHAAGHSRRAELPQVRRWISHSASGVCSRATAGAPFGHPSTGVVPPRGGCGGVWLAGGYERPWRAPSHPIGWCGYSRVTTAARVMLAERAGRGARGDTTHNTHNTHNTPAPCMAGRRPVRWRRWRHWRQWRRVSAPHVRWI